jgi:hypothetical protein
LFYLKVSSPDIVVNQSKDSIEEKIFDDVLYDDLLNQIGLGGNANGKLTLLFIIQDFVN